jgi:hypothetical protein
MNGNRPAKVKVTHGCRVIIIILFTHWHTVHSKMYYTPTTFKRSTTLIKRLLVRFKQTSYIPRSKFRDHHTNSHSQRDHLQRYCYSRTYPHAHSSINTPYYYNTNTVIPRMDIHGCSNAISRGHTWPTTQHYPPPRSQGHRHMSTCCARKTEAHCSATTRNYASSHVLLAHQHRHTCSGTTYAHFTNGPFTTYTGNIY